MQINKLLNLVVGIVVLLISASDFYKGIQMLFKKQNPLLFIAQITVWLIKLMPPAIRELKYQRSIEVYKKRRIFYGICAVLGGILGILVAIFYIKINL